MPCLPVIPPLAKWRENLRTEGCAAVPAGQGKGSPSIDFLYILMYIYGGRKEPMLRELPMTEARHELTSLPERLARHPGVVAVSRRGRPVLAIMPWEFYESLMETLEILSDRDFVKTLRQGIRELQEGKAVSWEKAKKELGW